AAILCISAHYETVGTHITAAAMPKTIHDFYGFPPALFNTTYPVPGSPILASATKNLVTKTDVTLDNNWGLDHGSWSILKNMYPLANIPVLEMSLDTRLTPIQHYALAKELKALRTRGVLIIGSGNMVHNLGNMNWQLPNAGFDWAEVANTQIKNAISNHTHEHLYQPNLWDRNMQMSVPTLEHFLPLLYTLGLQEENETARLFNDKTIYGSISMTSLMIA
ncbi:MAG: dioxygenase, partial [Bacteroidetes bacterium]|nr:dioxygenase [Bacteroidota bacterium]